MFLSELFVVFLVLDHNRIEQKKLFTTLCPKLSERKNRRENDYSVKISDMAKGSPLFRRVGWGVLADFLRCGSREYNSTLKALRKIFPHWSLIVLSQYSLTHDSANRDFAKIFDNRGLWLTPLATSVNDVGLAIQYSVVYLLIRGQHTIRTQSLSAIIILSPNCLIAKRCYEISCKNTVYPILLRTKD